MADGSVMSMEIFAGKPCAHTHAHQQKYRRDQAGASFVVALLLLLVMTLVSVGVVSAAGVAVERSRTDVREQQAYYAVSSGAKLAQSLLKSEDGPVGALVLTRNAQGVLDAGSTSDNSELAQWAIAAAQAVSAGKTPASYETKIDAFQAGAQEVPAVKLVFTMGDKGAEQYYISVVASLESGQDYAWKLTTTVPAHISGGTAGNYTVSWKEQARGARWASPW
ncbi:MAG: hypothetical protein ACOX4F_01655 [Atopobiaceae bacterium]|jgi:hypothetical protein